MKASYYILTSAIDTNDGNDNNDNHHHNRNTIMMTRMLKRKLKEMVNS